MLGAGVEPARLATPLSRSGTSTELRHPSEECRRRESNPQNVDSESSASASWATPAAESCRRAPRRARHAACSSRDPNRRPGNRTLRIQFVRLISPPGELAPYRAFPKNPAHGRGGTRTPDPGFVDLCDLHFTTRPKITSPSINKPLFLDVRTVLPLERRRHLDPAGIEPASSVCKTETLPLSHGPVTRTRCTGMPPAGIEPAPPAFQTGAPTTYAREARRLVGESNPSRPRDSRAATPVASRGRELGWLAGLEPALSGFTDRRLVRFVFNHQNPRAGSRTLIACTAAARQVSCH